MRFINCAILLAFPLLDVADGQGNFLEHHFRYIAGGDAKGVHGFAGVEVQYRRKIYKLGVLVGSAAQTPLQQHI